MNSEGMTLVYMLTQEKNTGLTFAEDPGTLMLQILLTLLTSGMKSNKLGKEYFTMKMVIHKFQHCLGKVIDLFLRILRIFL